MNKLLGLFLAALLLFTTLPVTALAEGTELTVTDTETRSGGQKGTIVNCKTAVNVRAKATSKSKLLGKAKKGETFPVLGRSGNWVRISFNDGEGFVFKTYICVTGTADDTPVEGKEGTIVNCKVAVNVREKATSKSKLLGTAKRGETFKVLATAGSWVKIRFDAKTDGYVFKTYIKIRDEGSDPDPTGRTAMIVNCKVAANVRAKASSKSKLLGTAARGAIYDVLGISGNWVKIDYDDGRAGYVFRRYVKLSESGEPIEGKTGTIRCNNHVNIRAKATKKSTLLGTAKNGETFTVKGRSGNWICIDFKGKTGYVYKSYIRIG
jgi:uncharacterized protein YgiM (DUF1202 family)